MIAAKETEKRVQAQLHDELDVAIKGVEVDLQSAVNRADSLNNNSQAGRDRIARLASARAEYANLIAAVDNHSKLVEAARKNLADARADHASAHTASVIGRIDGVESGVQPIGPGRMTITAGGGVAGLIFGFGLVFLFAVPRPAAVVEVAKTQASESVSSEARGDVKVAAGPQTAVRFVASMTLEEAVRSVEKRLSTRSN